MFWGVIHLTAAGWHVFCRLELRMRRGLQFVAVLVLGFLAGAPVLGGLACAVQPVMGSGCPMDMSNMASDCPMSRAGVQECQLDCCARSQNAVAAQDVVFFKQRHVVTDPLWAPDGTTYEAPRELAASVMSVPETSSPPVYILNRVFRI
jgi:hypothetical protein